MVNKHELQFLEKVLSGEINKMSGQEVLTLLVGTVAEFAITIGKLEKEINALKEKEKSDE